jgi:probable phosphoglycerate mutase
MGDEERIEIYLARHGETEWSLAGRHTGRTDLPLTIHGEDNARALGVRLARTGFRFRHVLTSPLARARHTCELAGYGDAAEVDPELAEWDYGDYEGLTSAEVHEQRSGWDVFRHGCPGGESVDEVTARADRVIERLRGLGGRVLLFGHGHFSRALGVRWIGLDLAWGRRLALSTAALGVLGHEASHRAPAILLWNDHSHVER